jgi:hypothetical protein
VRLSRKEGRGVPSLNTGDLTSTRCTQQEVAELVRNWVKCSKLSCSAPPQAPVLALKLFINYNYGLWRCKTGCISSPLDHTSHPRPSPSLHRGKKTTKNCKRLQHHSYSTLRNPRQKINNKKTLVFRIAHEAPCPTLEPSYEGDPT